MSTPYIHIKPVTPTMIAGYTMVLLGSSLLVMAANLPGSTGTERYILISLAASMIGSSTAFLVNSENEKLRVVLGRALFSAVTGLVAPIVGDNFFESVHKALSVHAIMVFGASFAASLVGFIVSLPLIHWTKKNSKKIVDKWGSRYLPEEEDQPTDVRHAGSESRKRKKRL